MLVDGHGAKSNWQGVKPVRQFYRSCEEWRRLAFPEPFVSMQSNYNASL